MKKIYQFFFIFLIACISGCTQRMFNFTFISTKEIDLSRAGNFEKYTRTTRGIDEIYWVVFLPLGIPHIEKAIDKAIDNTPGAIAITHGTVYSKTWWAIFSGASSYVVEGTPLIDPSLSAAPIGKYNYCQLDRKGEIVYSSVLSEEEFKRIKDKVLK